QGRTARNGNAAKITSRTPLCSRAARPSGAARAPTATVSTNSTIWVALSPSTSRPGSQIDTTAIVGMVSPMLAIAEPKARFEADLQTAALSVAYRSQRLGQQYQ